MNIKNLELLRAIEAYDPMTSDYELYWQLALCPPSDYEEMAQNSWSLSNGSPENGTPPLPIPFVALACRFCLETCTNQHALVTAYVFLYAHSDQYQPGLEAVAARLGLKIPPDLIGK